MAYNGTIKVIAGLKQANNGNFPIVDSSAVRVDDNTNLSGKLASIDSALENVGGTIPTTTSQLTNNSGFITNAVSNLTNYYNKTEVDSKVASVYKYKGIIATYSALPTTNLTIGDVYDITESGMNYAWNGTSWDALGSSVDLTGYYTKTETDTKLNAKVNTSNLSSVATSGSYNDLTNKPNVDSAMSNTSTNAVQNKVIKAYVDDVKADTNTLGGNVQTLQTSVNNITSGTTSVGKAKNYDTTTGNIKTKFEEITTALAGKAASNASYLKSETYTKAEVDAKLSSVYRFRGSLPGDYEDGTSTLNSNGTLNLDEESWIDSDNAAWQTGDVLNIPFAFTTDASFEEGAGKQYAAGTNIACIKYGTTIRWDVLGGSMTVNLTNYATNSSVDTKIANAITNALGGNY